MTHIDKLLIETQPKNIFSMFYNNGMSLTNSKIFTWNRHFLHLI